MRTVLRALVLRQLADAQPSGKVAGNVGLTPKTVADQPTLSARRAGSGLVRAGTAGKRSAVGRPTAAAHRLWVRPPPEGRARWTVRLLAEEAVKRSHAGVGRETVRTCSKATT